MSSTLNLRIASVLAAVVCAIITIGFTVAPAITPVSGLVA